MCSLPPLAWRLKYIHSPLVGRPVARLKALASAAADADHRSFGPQRARPQDDRTRGERGWVCGGSHYHDPSITKWDIFHYIYAVLHHRDYRERYTANLRRELPRIPFAGFATEAKASLEGAPNAGLKPGSSTAVPQDGGSDVEERPFEGRVTKRKKTNSTLPKAVAAERSSQATESTTDAELFRALAKAGQRLAEIHVHYEQQPEYKLTKVEKAGEKLDYHVKKMKLSKDKTTLIYNQFLTLSGIPKETYEYRLGNRSALEWIIDQYQVSTDKRSGITNDPNRPDDPQYILRLISQVITVSLETVKIVRSLPPLGLPL
jgi:hypothetical protein